MHMPDSFGTSIIVPVPKGDSSKLSVFEGYRLVSLISVFSKVFELCLLNVLSSFIINNDLQFGLLLVRAVRKRCW